MNRLRVWGSLALVAAFSVAATAQSFRGVILGTVSDVSGAAVAGAKVTVRNEATGLVRETETSDDGSYTVPELPIGAYTVTVEKAGFQTSVTSGVRVEVAG
ncbi:MAG TPA: carboxypeptidase-like regulatory domain-containing protein, partial [Candidatus Acidoferrales bacterium]|nr:carboxypeptidase-like regulatory domain-containing protein [Candidatus Acidoferrales bacterium]